MNTPKMTSLLIEPALSTTKVCNKCGRELPLSEFNKCRENKDGLQGTCRQCFSEYNKNRYRSNPEKFKEDVRKYRSENKLNVFDTRLRICEKNPTMINAQKAVDEALRAGVLVRPDTCSGCGCSSSEHRIEAHHHDYSKPLEVIWLCTPCHRRLDAMRRLNEGKSAYGDRGDAHAAKD